MALKVGVAWNHISCQQVERGNEPGEIELPSAILFSTLVRNGRRACQDHVFYANGAIKVENVNE